MMGPYRVVFVFATELEASHLLDRIAARTIPHGSRCLLAAHGSGPYSDCLVLVCGMGPAAAGSAMVSALDQFAVYQVINCGVAGSLTDHLPVGAIVQVQAVANLDAGNPAETARFHTLSAVRVAAMSKACRHARLVTQNKPVFDETRRAELAAVAELVDMEGAAIAAVCAHQHVPCAIFKIVSDHAVNRDMLLDNVRHTSWRLADYLVFHFNTFANLYEQHDTSQVRTACQRRG